METKALLMMVGCFLLAGILTTVVADAWMREPRDYLVAYAGMTKQGASFNGSAILTVDRSKTTKPDLEKWLRDDYEKRYGAVESLAVQSVQRWTFK